MHCNDMIRFGKKYFDTYNNDINKQIDGGSTTEITYFKIKYFLQYYKFQTNHFYELNIYIEHYTFT